MFERDVNEVMRIESVTQKSNIQRVVNNNSLASSAMPS
jgi:hypothetical protein